MFLLKNFGILIVLRLIVTVSSISSPLRKACTGYPNVLHFGLQYDLCIQAREFGRGFESDHGGSHVPIFMRRVG